MSARTERIVAALALAAALLAWFPGLLAGEAISVADVLYIYPPWEAVKPAGFRLPSNKLLLDQALQVYPWADQLRRRLRAGDLPLWNPYSDCGTPFLANQNAGVLSPFHLPLLLASNTALGLTLVALAKLAVAFAGARALARRVGGGALTSSLSGLVYAFCGPSLVWLGHPLTTASPLLPWSLLFTEDFLAATGKARARAALGLALATLCHFLGSHPETSAHIVMATAAWAALRALALHGRRSLGPLTRCALLLGLGLLAAGVQIAPFLSTLGRSYARTLRTTYPEQFRIPWSALPLALAPRLYGTPMELNAREEATPGLNFAESALFVGVIPLLLLGIAGRERSADPRRRALLWLGFGSLLVALDAAGVSHNLLARLPLIGLGAHHRLILVWALAVSVLLAPALERLAQPGPGRSGTLVSTALALLLLGAGLLTARAAQALGPRTLGYAGFAALLVVLAAAAARLAPRFPRAVPAGAAALVLLDLWLFGRGINPTIPAAAVFPSTPALQHLAGAAGSFRIAALGRALPSNAGAPYGLLDARGYEPLYSDAYQRFWFEAVSSRAAMDGLEAEELRFPPALRLLGVRYLLSPRDAPAPVLEGLRLRAVHAGGDARVVEVDDPLPLAFALSAWDVAADAGEAGRRIREGYPFSRRVLLDRPPFPAPGAPPPAEREAVALALERPRAELVRLRASGPAAAVAVLAESSDPGWSVRVDGKPAALLTAYGIFLAVALPPGEHEIEFRYRPAGLDAGIAASLAGALGLLLLGRAAWRLR